MSTTIKPRFASAGIAAALAALLSGSGAGAAAVGGVTFSPPYDGLPHQAISAIATPCAQAPSRWTLATRKPNATNGHLDLSIGLAGRRCRILGITRWDSWKLGNAVPLFLGRPATVTVSLAPQRFRAFALGTGDAVASFGLAVSGKAHTGGPFHDVWRLSCAGKSRRCSSSSNRAARDLTFSLAGVPTMLYLNIRRDASMNGTFQVGMLLETVVRRVTIQPAIELPGY
jgi:hypothetical protein